MRVWQSNWLGRLVAGAAVLMAALVLGAGPLRLAAAPPAPAAVLPPAEKGLLFSAILFGDTELGRRWGRCRTEAAALFPHLKLKAVPDLHVTLFYIGANWQGERLDALRAAMKVEFKQTIHFVPEMTRLGKHDQVVAVELKGIPEDFVAQVVNIKARLNAAHLKRPDAYDASFRAHVTLAEVPGAAPTPAEAQELARFQTWVGPRLDLASLKLSIGPATPVHFLLAGATAPAAVPEYLPLERSPAAHDPR